MSSPVRILIGLAAGLVGGFLFSSAGLNADSAIVSTADTLGGLWIAALRMTILPLVFALVVTGVAARMEVGSAGGTAGKSIAVFTLILIAGTAMTAVLVPFVLSLWSTSPATTAAMRHALNLGTKIPALPSIATMIRGFIPSNLFSAAANDNMLPVVMFALAFGFAAGNAAGERSAGLSTFFEWIRDTMLTIVGWILKIAPLGVFLLAFGLGAKTGFSALGAVAQYIALAVAMAVVAISLAIGVAVLAGGVPIRRFVRAAVTPQSIAFSTRSSVATLPAMLKACEEVLKLPQRVTSVTLPLAVSMFRICGPVASFTAAIYSAHVLGIQLGPYQLAIGGIIAIIVIAAGAGVPGEVTFFATYVPIFNAMGVPIEILVLLIAVQAIPDMFNTVSNVTMDMAATSVVARLARQDVTAEVEPPVVIAGK